MMSTDQTPSGGETPDTRGNWLSTAAWILALAAVGVVGYVAWQVRSPGLGRVSQPAPEIAPAPEDAVISLPALAIREPAPRLARTADLDTIIPDRPDPKVVQYTVDQGDSVFGIAQFFDIEPETVLWANYDLLNDNPDYLEPGMDLNIPPINGVYYTWEAGDTLEAVAARFEASAEDILLFPGNRLDLVEPQIEPGDLIMVPDGRREFRQWIVPTIPRDAAGVSKSLYGPGACDGGYTGAFGSGTFIYPTFNHTLSGNDYWSGHLGIDLAAGAGDQIRAADSGVVVFSGWATGGYGYMVMIDHGNGYQTLYAHLNQALARCGQSVGQGGVVGLAGSTGNSTGVHLHFEVRYQGGFISPWFVLPAP